MSIIILDTDAGLDDAAAILLGQVTGLHPEYYICTEGNTTADNVVRNVSILDKYLGLSARIVKGCEVHPDHADDFFGADGLGNLSQQMMTDHHITQEDIKPDLSYEAFKQELLQYESPDYDHITYIAIGPLITLADLIRDPAIKSRIDHVYIMGGGIHEFNAPDDSEFNFHDNPEAAAQVLGSGLDITLFPLDLTIHQSIDEEQIRRLEATGKYPEYIDMFRFIKKQTLDYDRIDAAILHDTMPVLYCTCPDKYTLEDVKLTIDANAHLDITDDGYPVHLATRVDPTLLFTSLKKAFEL